MDVLEEMILDWKWRPLSLIRIAQRAHTPKKVLILRVSFSVMRSIKYAPVFSSVHRLLDSWILKLGFPWRQESFTNKTLTDQKLILERTETVKTRPPQEEAEL